MHALPVIETVDSFVSNEDKKYTLDAKETDRGTYYYYAVNGSKCDLPISRKYFQSLKDKLT